MKAPLSITEIYAARQAQARAGEGGLPHLPPVLGTGLMSLSVLIMAFSGLYPVVPILLFFALWLPLPLLYGRALLPDIRRTALLYLLPLLMMASGFWSREMGHSFYLGTAFVVMMLVIGIAAKALSPESFTRGLMLGVLLVLVVTLASGRQAVDFLSGSAALTGLFGSKNVVGLFAETGILAGLLGLWRPEVKGVRQSWLVLPLLALSAASLWLAHSGTSVLTLLLTLLALVVFNAVVAMPKSLRAPLLVILLSLGVAFVIAFALAGGDALLLSLMGKDATLTGRTYLWQQGVRYALEHPWLGHGYAAFWVQGNPLAESYWEMFHIEDRKGFHFHSAYVQCLVDLGIVGVCSLLLLMLATLWVAAKRAARHCRGLPLLMLALALMFLLRSPVEVDFIISPFGLGPWLFFAILARARSVCASPPAPRASAPLPDSAAIPR